MGLYLQLVEGREFPERCPLQMARRRFRKLAAVALDQIMQGSLQLVGTDDAVQDVVVACLALHVPERFFAAARFLCDAPGFAFFEVLQFLFQALQHF